MQNRAKQFMSFEPLKGFREMLIEKEKEIIELKELNNDYLEYLNRDINKINKGDIIIVVYYKEMDYKRLRGKLKYIDRIKKELIIDNERIMFDLILSIKKEAKTS